MAARLRKDTGKWIATKETSTGRIQRTFESQETAEKWDRLMNGCTLLRLHSICSTLDWQSKDPGQKKRAARLIRFLGEGTHPGQITSGVIDDLVSHRRAAGNGNSSLCKDLSALRVMLKRAERLEWIDRLPLFPETRTLKLPEPRDLVIRDEWFRELLDVMEKQEQRMPMMTTRFIRWSGCRVDEALSLDWDRVDLRKGTVQFVLTKGTNPRRLPLNDEMKSLLSAARSFGSQRLVFPLSYDVFRARYRKAVSQVCANLGLGPAIEKQWVIHTLRHTRITELASNGFNAPTIQQWAGHKSLAITQRYIHGAGVDLTGLANC